MIGGREEAAAVAAVAAVANFVPLSVFVFCLVGEREKKEGGKEGGREGGRTRERHKKKVRKSESEWSSRMQSEK